MIRTQTFQKIGGSFQRSGKCGGCGKPMKRSKEFYQTLNPYNKNKNGKLKTAQDIHKELSVKVDEWKATPLFHVKCEGVVA